MSASGVGGGGCWWGRGEGRKPAKAKEIRANVRILAGTYPETEAISAQVGFAFTVWSCCDVVRKELQNKQPRLGGGGGGYEMITVVLNLSPKPAGSQGNASAAASFELRC